MSECDYDDLYGDLDDIHKHEEQEAVSVKQNYCIIMDIVRV